MIKKILIANRGEIALRVMRTAREMGIKTVAVFSEADRIFIGEAPSNKSYLDINKIINAAKQSGADAIHPGYGFLSENGTFSDEVGKAGLIFIGPSGDSMRQMGSKLGAKATAKRFNIPLVPGTDTALKNLDEAKAIAQKIGFPVLIKASAGGGGKGMRIVNKANDFEEQIQLAQSEAKSAFGDDAVFIERYVAAPRHIEIQILGDKHGNVVYLFERECSVQRRHQKVVEEAPSSVLTPAIRQAMGQCAVDVAKACNYEGAGTVEFLLDENLNFYFLEMNTRLQVEHPVSECITGLDLVREQIKIANGEPLSFNQSDLKIDGHAIEIRVYAEDPSNGFLPDIGTLTTYKTPKGPGVRVDDGYEQGMEIPIYYDPMIAKLIVHAANRTEAIDKMIRAIDEYQINGVATTLPFCKFVMQHEAFRSGNFDTNFVSKYFNPDLLISNHEPYNELAALLSAHFMSQSNGSPAKNIQSEGAKSNWKINRTTFT
jgi:acetyl-CoA carboxylase, biotin carboxylase subunit